MHLLISSTGERVCIRPLTIEYRLEQRQPALVDSDGRAARRFKMDSIPLDIRFPASSLSLSTGISLPSLTQVR